MYLIRLVFIVMLVPFCACSANQSQTDATMPAHHTQDGFRNLYVEPKSGGFFTFMRMRYFGDDEWADYEANADKVERVTPQLDKILNPGEEPQITWIGHATVLIQYRGINMLTDPVFAERASPFSFMGPKRVTPPALTIAQLPPIDYVLISHNHYDHLDADTVKQLGNHPTWLVPLNYKAWFADLGVTNIVELDWWAQLETENISITATPSQHWTGRSLGDRYESLWGSWSVQIDDFKFWFAGDTGYNDKIFNEIGKRQGPYDLALIPIGGYAPRWFMKDMHVNPEEALQLHNDIHSAYSIGIHWGAFPLTSEPIDEPPQRLREAAKSLTDSVFVTLPLGTTSQVPKLKGQGTDHEPKQP